jgi:hypothetical protein
MKESVKKCNGVAQQQPFVHQMQQQYMCNKVMNTRTNEETNKVIVQKQPVLLLLHT